jgi:multiple sugar transport system permease protein
MKSPLRSQQNATGWLMVLPIVAGTLIFSLVPVAFSLAMSLTKWNAINPPEFTGLANFRNLILTDVRFHGAVWNTALFAAGSVVVGLVFGLILALLANMRVFGQTFYRTAFFAPTVTSTIAIGIVWSYIFQPYMGLINSLLYSMGITGPDWLGSTRTALLSVIIVQVWFVSGYNMVIYLAGLQAVPESFYESGRIDGASSFRLFWHITLPMLSPTTFFLTITSLIASIQIFDLIFVMTRGGPGFASTVYIHYLYSRAFQYSQMGYASAMAWALFLVIAGVTMVQWKLQRYWVFYQ